VVHHLMQIILLSMFICTSFFDEFKNTIIVAVLSPIQNWL